jgi:hypothetical protein
MIGNDGERLIARFLNLKMPLFSGKRSAMKPAQITILHDQNEMTFAMRQLHL